MFHLDVSISREATEPPRREGRSTPVIVNEQLAVRSRLVKVRVLTVVGVCLEPHVSYAVVVVPISITIR